MKPETKEKIKHNTKHVLKGVWVFFAEIIAPSVVIGSIGAAAQLKGFHAIVFLASGLTLFWMIKMKADQKPSFKFRIRHITHLPAEGALDWDTFRDADTLDHIDEERNLKPHTVLVLRDNNTFFQIPTECFTDAVMLLRALNDYSSDEKQIEYCCPKGREIEAMAKMSAAKAERDGEPSFHPDHDNRPDSNCNCPSCR